MAYKKYLLGLLLTISLLAWISLSATGQVSDNFSSHFSNDNSGTLHSSHDNSSLSSHDAAQSSVEVAAANNALPTAHGDAPGWQEFGLLKAVYR